MKICNKCNEELSLNDFYTSKKIKDGYENTCKKCRENARKTYKLVCLECGQEFLGKRKTQVFCNSECRVNSTKNRIISNCSVCNKTVERKSSQMNLQGNIYCSNECRHIGHSQQTSGDNHFRFASIEIPCDYCSKKILRKPSTLKANKYNYCSNECRHKGWTKYYSGVNSPMYDDTISDEERYNNRKYEEYYQWRINVFERDNFTCQKCNDNKGHNLVSHHILNFSEYVEFRTQLDNGITLCETCHKEFHDTYGYTKNNRNQLKEYLKP